jgi:hypothetical protein
MLDQTSAPDSLPETEITIANPSPTPRWVVVVLELFVGAVVGYVVVGIAVLELSPVRPPPPLPPILGAVASALLALMIPLRRPWTVVRIGRNSIILARSTDDAQEVYCRDIQLITGEAGINLDGGKMIVWKRVRIATPTGSYAIMLQPKQNDACYRHLLLACPGAVGVSYTGEVHLPEVPEGSINLECMASVLHVAAREFGRQTRCAVGVASLMALVTAGLLVVVFLATTSAKPGENLDKVGSLVVNLLVFGAVTVIFAGRALRQYFRGRRIVRTLHRLVRGHTGADR